jgi:hypothetical protein
MFFTIILWDACGFDDQSWVLLLSRGSQRKLHTQARNPLPARNICTSGVGSSPLLKKRHLFAIYRINRSFSP